MSPSAFSRLLLLALVVLLGGCFLKVTVDAGGQVTTVAFSDTCVGSADCTYDIPGGVDFNDTLTAAASTGFKFAGWEGLWCNGSVNPSCPIATPAGWTAFELETLQIAHFNRPIVGTWIAGSAADPDNLALYTFYENGGYVIAEICDDPLAANPEGGYEQGTYTWDDMTGAFGSTVLNESTGDCGARMSNGSPNFDNAAVNGDALTLTLGAQPVDTLQRLVPKSSDRLTGSWVIGDPSDASPGGFAQVTFITEGPFGYYVVAEECLEDGLPPGIEYGLYTWGNPNPRDFATITSGDTMGNCGFKSNDGSPGIVQIKGPGRTAKLVEQGTGEITVLTGLF